MADRAVWYANFNTQIQMIGLTLGLVAGDLAKINDDRTMIEFLAEVSIGTETYADGTRQFRKVLTEGDVGDMAPSFPMNPTFDPPVTPVTGIFERLDDYVKRIRTAPNYTDETGAVLGITPSAGPPPPIGSVPPVIKGTSLPGNNIEVTFVRGNSSGVLLQTEIDNSGTFADAGRFFRSPAELTVQGNNGLPRSVQIRARFLDGNAAVGQWSDVATVQTIP